jgi:YbbR domain-containing protein
MPRGSKSFWRIEPRQFVDFFRKHLGLKMMALVLSFLLWTVLKADEQQSIVIDDVEIRINNTDLDWVRQGELVPPTASLVVSGPTRDLLRLKVGRAMIVVPIDEVTDSAMLVSIRPQHARFTTQGGNASVSEIRPSTIRVNFEPMRSEFFPVAVQLTGSPVPGFEQEGRVIIEPAEVRVSGPRSRIAALDSIRLPPLDLSGRSATDTQVVAVDPPESTIVSPVQVQVIIPIMPIGRGGGAPTPGDR